MSPVEPRRTADKVPVIFRLTLRSGFTIGVRRQDRTPATLTHIPGTTLRGALLAAHVRRHGKDAVFERLCDPARNRFPFLYPELASWKDRPPWEAPGLRPRSWVACKREPTAHGLEDVLLSRARLVLAPSRETKGALDKVYRCPRCGEDRKPSTGYRQGTVAVSNPVSTQRTNVGIARTTASAYAGILFGAMVVEPLAVQWAGGLGAGAESQPKAPSRLDPARRKDRLVLSGLGWCHPEDVEALSTLRVLYLGKRRSRGQGEAKLEVQEYTFPALEGRTEEIRQAALAWGDLLGQAHEAFFPLDVRSPLLLWDRILRPSTDVESFLADALAPIPVRVADALPATRPVSGWDMATGVPKPSFEVVDAGSVYLLAAPRDQAGALAARLAQLERDGLGGGWSAGFGSVFVHEPWRSRKH